MRRQWESRARGGLWLCGALALAGCGSKKPLPGAADAGTGDAIADRQAPPDDAHSDDETVDLGDDGAVSGGGAGGFGGGAGVPGVGGGDAGGGAGSSGAGGAAGQLGGTADILIVLDRSASMQDGANGPATVTDPSKWSQVSDALTELLDSCAGAGSWGIKSFPEEVVGACNPVSVTSRIDVPIAAGNAGAVSTAIRLMTPNGDGTPTSAAVRAAADYLRSLPPRRSRYLLLVTDGTPSCAGNAGAVAFADATTARADTVSAISETAAAGFHTFVVGVATTSAITSATLNQLAIAGLEPRPDPRPLAQRFYAANDRTELGGVLRAITGTVGACGGSAPDGGADGGADAGSAPGSPLFFDDFEAGNLDNWVAADPAPLGNWAVADEGSNHLLVQSDATLSSTGIAAGNVGWTDQLLEARVELMGTPNEIRLAGRFRDAMTYYFLELSASGRVKIRKREVGATTDLVASVGTPVPLVTGRFYDLALRIEGATLTAYLDGTLVASANDPGTPIASGGIALLTASTAAAFDNVRVTVP